MKFFKASLWLIGAVVLLVLPLIVEYVREYLDPRYYEMRKP